MDTADLVATMVADMAQLERIGREMTALDGRRLALRHEQNEVWGRLRSRCEGLAAFGIDCPDARVRVWCDEDRHQQRVRNMT